MGKSADRSRLDAPGVDSSPHHVIQAIEVQGGFLDGMKLDLLDGLNCIIGGRGTGKTTLLEYARFVLGAMPDPKSARHKALAALFQSNLRHGRVRIQVKTKHGARYTIERSWSDAPRILDEKGKPAQVSLDRDLLFGADFYSVNEIEEIAVDPALQLALLDKFAEGEVRRVTEEARKALRELETSGMDVARGSRETRDLEEAAAELPAVEEKLKALDETEGPGADKLNKAHAAKAHRDKERRMFELLEKNAGSVAADVESALTLAARRIDAQLAPDLVEGANRKIFQKVVKPASELADSLVEFAKETQRRAESLVTALKKQLGELEAVHAEQDAEYRELVLRSKDASERAATRADLNRRHAEVAAAKRELEQRHSELTVRLERRKELMAKLSACRDERSALRRSVAERLTARLAPAGIRISVLQAGDREAYREALALALKGSGLRGLSTSIEAVVQNLVPSELVELVRTGRSDALADRTGLDAERARKVSELLQDPAVCCSLETVDVQDAPRIELLDGKVYKDSSGLSTGQRCTTILAILLVESDRVLLVDQPEDNLDNSYIFQSVVKVLRKVKGTRQLVFVTHNPNIPVLGDAERVFELASDGQRARLAAQGTVDELKGRIEELLEGGHEAFWERKERYGY